MGMPGFAAEASFYQTKSQRVGLPWRNERELTAVEEGLQPTCACGPKGDEGCICNREQDCLPTQSCSCLGCYDYGFGPIHFRGGDCKCVP